MNALSLAMNNGIQTLAIVDDDRSLAEMAGWQAEDAGYSWFIVEGSYADVGILAEHIMKNAQGALCDHRLARRGLASFPGASLVATLFDRRFPAVLTTQYVGIDADVSIRKWRDKIPVLLSRDETDASAIKDGFAACVSELAGNVPSQRIPHRVLLRITETSSESGEMVVDAVIPSWNPRKAVRFPASLVPQEFQEKLLPDARFFASVNIGAEASEELFFRQFEFAPEPDEDDGLA